MHKQWKRLPHIDSPELIQLITFRLNDALPAPVQRELRLRHEIEEPSVPIEVAIDSSLDEGYGECVLASPEAASILESTLLHGHGDAYTLLAWIIMPNHVHALVHIAPRSTLSDVVQSWKSVTAHRINRRLGRSGKLWQQDYFDRYMRDGRHIGRTIDYIHDNPVKAGLCNRPDTWRFSSAHPSKGWDPWAWLTERW